MAVYDGVEEPEEDVCDSRGSSERPSLDDEVEEVSSRDVGEN